jgi:Xaa-Pro aminopeptidase
MLPSGLVLARRLTDLRTSLAAQGLDALVVTHQPNLRYLVNHVGSAGLAVVTHGGVELLVDARYTEAVRSRQLFPEACPGLQVRLVPGSYDDARVECLRGLGDGAVGFEARHVSVATYDAWQNRLGPAAARLRPTQRLIERARAVKDEFEIACLRRAAAGLTAVADAAFAALRPGASEHEVAGVIESSLREGGYERPAFDVIVASGPNAALPHHRAGPRRMDLGDLVVLDFGGVLDGYCSDLTRTVSVGPPSEDARRVHAAVLRAQRAAIAAVKPGVETSAVDRAARAVLESEGLGEAFGHGTGHGLGLEVHEEPRLARASTAGDSTPSPLRAGMVVTIEPGAYLPGWGGVRIEDDVVVTAGGAELLTAVSYDLQPCGAGQQSGSAWT